MRRSAPSYAPAVELAPLTDRQLADYARDGYVVLGFVLDAPERDALLAEERRFRPDRSYGAAGASAGLLVRDQLCPFSAPVRSFCLEGAHTAILPQLLGPDVCFTHTQFITKLPGADTDGHDATFIPLHQDDGYGTLDPLEDVTVWTALTDTTEDNGCLVIVPGSHRGGLVDHAVAATNPALREVVVDGAVPVPLAAGEAVAFHGLTLHGSGPNRSTEARVGMHARYCLPHARMLTEGGKPVLDDAHSWMVCGEASLDLWGSANDKFLREGEAARA